MAKYQVKPTQDGQFAIYNSTGTRYFPSTVNADRDEVEKTAAIWTIQHFYNQAREVYDAAVEKGLLDADFGDYIS